MLVDDESIVEYQVMLLDWYKENKRMYPWRYTFDPYKVLISEILLQRTNANQAVAPFNKLIDQCSNIFVLAGMSDTFFEGIFLSTGLYYRAQRLKQISLEIVNKYNGKIPDTSDALVEINGIGLYIAGAILCFGHNKLAPIVDSNVIRVFDRLWGYKSLKSKPHEDQHLWNFAEQLVPQNDYVDYNYSLLDFAAKICMPQKPLCKSCGLKYICTKNR
jgi:A/G-specific adenine glycosylase